MFVNMSMLEPHYFSNNSDLHILIVFCLSLTSHLNSVCAYFCSVSQEMTDIVRAIYDMMGKYTYPVLKTEAPKQHVDAFFQVTHLKPNNTNIYSLPLNKNATM